TKPRRALSTRRSTNLTSCRGMRFNPRIGHANHAIAGDDSGEFVPAPMLGIRGASRQNEIAQVGEAVVDAHDNVVPEVGAEFAKYLARLFHDPGPVVLAAVPVRRQSEHCARITRAE